MVQYQWQKRQITPGLEVLEGSIEGIQKEIERREVQLRHRKLWYENPVKTTFYPVAMTFTMTGFYDGYRIMKEIEKLKVIRWELSQLK